MLCYVTILCYICYAQQPHEYSDRVGLQIQNRTMLLSLRYYISMSNVSEKGHFEDYKYNLCIVLHMQQQLKHFQIRL